MQAAELSVKININPDVFSKTSFRASQLQICQFKVISILPNKEESSTLVFLRMVMS